MPPSVRLPSALLLLVHALAAAAPDPAVLLPGQQIGPLRQASVVLEDGALAMDERGQLLVGMPGGYTGQTGTVHVRRREQGDWQVRQILVPPPEFRQTGARFGHALAVHGRWLLVGAPRETVNGVVQAGAGYLFRRRDGDEGYELVLNGRIIQQGVTGSGRQLGAAVAIGADFAALGVPGHSATGAAQSGQVLMLARQASNAWFLEGLLALPAGNPAAGAAFGSALAMTPSGDQVFVAAPDQTVADQAVAGRVYWFRRSSGAWQLRQQLSWTPVELLDRFGASLALQDGYLFVGAPARSKPGAAQTKGGGVRVYRRELSLDSWITEAELFPATAQAGARFGQALAALSTPQGPRLLVGVPRRNLGTVLIGVRTEAGEATVFEPSPVGAGHAWSPGATLRWGGSVLASASGNRFGSSVLLAPGASGTLAFAAAPGRSADGLTAGWVQAFDGDRVFADGFQSP